jgi:AAA domain
MELNDFVFDDEEFDNFLTEENNEVPDYNSIPEEYSCNILRSIGRHKCGFSKLPKYESTALPDASSFITTVSTPTQSILHESEVSDRNTPTPEEVITLLLHHTSFEQRSFLSVTGQDYLVSVLEPNGSAKSIINWAESSSLDLHQERAFEIMTSTFVLSYYREPDTERESYDAYYSERMKLRFLAHNNSRRSDQLICFLHGPGGSGKTAVINLVLLYAHSFCKQLWADFVSTERVIVVTAMTGAAATLLKGETTHSALFLNQRKDINREQIELWNNTKMVIIDEI